MIREGSNRIEGVTIALARIYQLAGGAAVITGDRVTNTVIIRPSHFGPFVNRDGAGIEGKILNRH